MSKLYIPALAVALIAGDSLAQQNYGASVPAAKARLSSEARLSTFRPGPASSGARGIAFWTEDFSGGAIPAGWTNVDELTPAADDPVTFVWSDDPTDVTVAALGNEEIVDFLADGASNGYLWANSDRGLPSAPPTEHLTRLTTDAIDCSGQPSVLFTMQSTIGVFDNNANEFVKVKVSTDLVTWTEFFPFPCLETGSPNPPCERFSFNPQNVAINITSVAANQPAVYLQFEWQGGWEYYWAIDDLELSPLPDNEIVMNYGYTSTTGLGEEYGRIPLDQLPSTMNVGAELFNFGGATQTNVMVDMEITGPGGPLTLNSMVGDLGSQETFVTDDDIDISALGMGDYTATFMVSSDQIGMDENPDDNMRVRTFEVTDFVYSLDNIGNHPPGLESLSQTGSGSFLDNSENVKLLNMYYINTTTTAYALEIGLDANTDPGSSLVVSILDTVDVLATPSVVNQTLAESDFYIITQADIDAGFVTIPFINEVELTPNAYYAVASCYADGDNDVFVIDDLTVPQPALASALWIPFDPDNNQNFYGGNGTAWAIRLITDPNVSVREQEELTGVTMFPNPTNGILNIRTTENEKYFVEVTNVLGEQVLSSTFANTTVLDLSPLADGVYTVRVSTGNKAMVKRITVK